MSFNNKSNFLDNVPTTQDYIPAVIDRQQCGFHDATYGVPCYQFQGATNDLWHIGICNRRALAAGVNGRISPSSLRTSSSKN